MLKSMSSAQKSEVKAWEEEITSCTHTTDLVQPVSKVLEPAGESHISPLYDAHTDWEQDSRHARNRDVD